MKYNSACPHYVVLGIARVVVMLTALLEPCDMATQLEPSLVVLMHVQFHLLDERLSQRLRLPAAARTVILRIRDSLILGRGGGRRRKGRRPVGLHARRTPRAKPVADLLDHRRGQFCSSYSISPSCTGSSKRRVMPEVPDRPGASGLATAVAVSRWPDGDPRTGGERREEEPHHQADEAAAEEAAKGTDASFATALSCRLSSSFSFAMCGLVLSTALCDENEGWRFLAPACET